jgi:hypothetical protein
MPGSARLSANYRGKTMRVRRLNLASGGHAKSGFPHRFRNNHKLAGFSQTTQPLSTANSLKDSSRGGNSGSDSRLGRPVREIPHVRTATPGCPQFDLSSRASVLSDAIFARSDRFLLELRYSRVPFRQRNESRTAITRPAKASWLRSTATECTGCGAATTSAPAC